MKPKFDFDQHCNVYWEAQQEYDVNSVHPFSSLSLIQGFTGFLEDKENCGEHPDVFKENFKEGKLCPIYLVVSYTIM